MTCGAIVVGSKKRCPKGVITLTGTTTDNKEEFLRIINSLSLPSGFDHLVLNKENCAVLILRDEVGVTVYCCGDSEVCRKAVQIEIESGNYEWLNDVTTNKIQWLKWEPGKPISS